LLIPAAAGVAVWVALADGTTRAPRGNVVGEAVRDLPVRRLAGERLVAGFDGPRAPRAMERMIRQGRLAGVILFSDNLGTRRHARRTIRRLQEIRRPPGLRDPLLVMVDQEGGLVKRLPGPPRASARRMGRAGAGFSRRQGAATARSLRAVGVNVDLAPVLDVGRPGSAIRAQRRSFGGTSRRVTRTAIPFAVAMGRWGVAAAAKHFPGLGAASQSTDVAVQRIRLSRAKLRRIDERPYRAFAAMGGDVVMLSTAVYPRFSAKPAAFSRRLATAELRSRVGFRGVSISDALETVAAREYGGPARVGVAAARAGTDLLLFTDHRAAAAAGHSLSRKLRSGTLSRPRFLRSVRRVLALRARSGAG
jgi:beta-N-acetylhexosaminidase